MKRVSICKSARFALASSTVLCLALMPLVLPPVFAAKPSKGPARLERPSFVRFDPAKYRGQTGKIILSIKGPAMAMLVERDKTGRRTYYELNSKSGTFLAPVGAFQLAGYMVYAPKQDKRGAPMLTGRYEKEPLVRVSGGRTCRITVGPPLTASAKVTQTGKTVTIDLLMRGRGGERCTAYGKEAPGFRILSKSGQLLQQGKFKYG